MDEFLECDIPISEFANDSEKRVFDDVIDEVNDAETDISVGISMDDGDMIDAIALGHDAVPDGETIKFADDQEDDSNLIKAVQDNEVDPDDAAYEREYPELHNEDPNDDGDDITEEDLKNISMDESVISSDLVDAVLEAREEIDND